MFQVTKYPHGAFSWADCLSINANQVKSFYAELMGWEIDDQPMGDGFVYTMYQKDGVSVAALSQMPLSLQQQGVPSHWNSYITVDDIDNLVEKVQALGGKIIAEPMDVFTAGRMMVIQDSAGAQVCLWQPQNHIGAGLVNIPGAMAWNELSTRNAQSAVEFYTNLLGWEAKKIDGREYYLLFNKGRLNAGLIQMDERWEDMPSVWMVFFAVADIEASLAKVKSLGGKVDTDIIETPRGRMAIIFDPSGAVLTLIQLHQPQPWQE